MRACACALFHGALDLNPSLYLLFTFSILLSIVRFLNYYYIISCSEGFFLFGENRPQIGVKKKKKLIYFDDLSE